MAKKPEDVEEMPICREKQFAAVLAHIVQLNEHLVTETGGDPEVLEGSSVTVGGDFLADCFDLLIEFASRYEGEIFNDLHDQLIDQYEMINRAKCGFGSKTRH